MNDDNTQTVRRGRYRHVKGNYYTLTAIAKHTETEESMAIYTDKDGKLWARPLVMFLERFTPVDGTDEAERKIAE